MHTQIAEILGDIGLVFEQTGWQFMMICLGTLFGIAIISHVITRFILHFKIMRLIGLTSNTWDDELVKHGVFTRLAHIVPAMVLYYGKFALIDENWSMFNFISSFVSLYIIFVFYRAINAILSAGESIYTRSELSKKAPITGFIQVAKLLVTLAMIFFVISLLLGKSPIYLLSGLTAVAAVLLLVFRDTILGFVAGIQIAANRMFNTGDWIEIPKYGVDGDIISIGLNVVKVQNWDKTISTIPTYTLTTDAVKNWRGMQLSGGRRIKRSIDIDMRSIEFARSQQLERWRKLALIKDYLDDKLSQLEQDAIRCKNESLDVLNSRRLTNIGTFRAYVSAYLKQHRDINQDMTCMVRQLKPSETGLPIEVYCFTNTTKWADYEHIQSEIFDHLLAILPVFDLSPYQRVTNNPRRPQIDKSQQ